jgi:hypothetical protein
MPLQLVVSREFSVRETDFDVGTGLQLQAGDRVHIDAWGNIWAGVWFTGLNGPRGWDWIDYNPKFPLPGTHPFCLLGKIGAGGYFYIGDNANIEGVPAPGGELLLRINDDVPANGNGAFTCLVQVYRDQ